MAILCQDVGHLDILVAAFGMARLSLIDFGFLFVRYVKLDAVHR